MLGSFCQAQEYRWPLDTPKALIAPTDSVGEQAITGASLQGALVDLRFGQACVEIEGTGILLDYTGKSSFTLDGKKSSAKELAERVKSGDSLTVAVRYNPESGLIGWMDGVSGKSMKAASVVFKPFKGPAYLPGQPMKIQVLEKVSESAFLRIPGVARKLPLNGKRASLDLLDGWNWRELPVFLVDGGEVRRGRKLSVASDSLNVDGAGPLVASSELNSVPCWVEFSGPGYLLDRVATKIQATDDAKVEKIQFGPGRINFWLAPQGLGPVTLDVTLVDQLGRESTYQWVVDFRS